MSADHDCPLCALSARLWADAADAEPAPRDEAVERQMEAIANSVDPETGRPTYRPRRTR